MFIYIWSCDEICWLIDDRESHIPFFFFSPFKPQKRLVTEIEMTLYHVYQNLPGSLGCILSLETVSVQWKMVWLQNGRDL